MSQKDINKAIVQLNNNNIPQAQKILLKILKKEPSNTKVLTLLSIIEFQNLNNIDQSLRYASQAIKFQSRDINSYLIAGISAMRLKKNDLAHQYLNAGYMMNGQNRDILFNLALNNVERGNLDEAVNLYEKCIMQNNHDYDAKINMANLLMRLNRDSDAERFYLELLPLNKPIIYKNYLSFLIKNYEFKKAEPIASRLYEIEGTEVNLLEYLRVAVQIKDIQLSEKLLDKIKIHSSSEYIYLLIMHYLNLEDYEKASDLFNEHYSLDDSGLNEKYLTLYCLILPGIKDTEFVKKQFELIIHKTSDKIIRKHYSLWLLEHYMFKEGFYYYPSRLSESQHDIVTLKDISIESLANKHMLLIGDQGIGDQIFFLRFIKHAQSFVKELSLAVDNRIIPIIKKYLPDIQIIAKQELIDNNDLRHRLRDYDVIQYLGDLPAHLNLKKETINQFLIRPDTKNKVKLNEEERIKIGISWNSKAGQLESEKSVSMEVIELLVKNSKFEFVNLQYENFEDINKLKQYNNFISHDEVDKKNDLVGLCDLIKSCDCVLTVSNVTAHLCGLLRKKTFLMIPNIKRAIWYWNHTKNNHSEWYPSVKVVKLKSKEAKSIYQEINQYLNH